MKDPSSVRGADGIEVSLEAGLDVAAGIRQPMTAFAAERPAGEPAFMQIQQAAAVRPDRASEAVDYLRSIVEQLKADGFVAAAMERSGQRADVAPPG